MQESIDPKALITYIGSKIDGLSGPEPGFTIVGHKSRCFELISGTKALQFVTFPENTWDHRSKGTDHLYRVHILWSEWSRTKILLYNLSHFQRGVASMQHF